MTYFQLRPWFIAGIASFAMTLVNASTVFAHGSADYPKSRVRQVYESNPENPSFELARTAVQMDGANAYYTWNQLSQNVPDAVNAGLPEGFDYSPWVPDGQLGSGGNSLYSGLDQVSADWPTTKVRVGTLSVQYISTAMHDPSVFDVWMTTQDWDPNTAMNWDQMEYLGRPTHTLVDSDYLFDVQIPSNRSGRHVLWISWHRNDPVGEVFFSTSDIIVGDEADDPGRGGGGSGSDAGTGGEVAPGDGGCGCSASDQGLGASAWLLMLLVGFSLRRREHI